MENYLNKQQGDVVKVEVKSVWASKTLWLNIISFVLGVVVLAEQSPLFADKAQVLTVLASVNALLNLVLRFISNNPITFKKGE